MFKEKIKSLWEEHKGIICLIGGMYIGGFVVSNVQRWKLDQVLKNSLVLKEAVNPMFSPETTLPEIREALSKIDGARVMDAIAANVNGKNHIFIR